jgi:hypothetical protein
MREDRLEFQRNGDEAIKPNSNISVPVADPSTGQGRRFPALFPGNCAVAPPENAAA